MSYKAQAAVGLISFTVEGGNRQVLIKWSTATETNTAAFLIHRSTSRDEGFEVIGDPVFSTGNPISGANYEILDTNVTNGTTYWYMLEEIENDNSKTIIAGPISALPQSATSTTTNTATLRAIGTLKTPTKMHTAKTATPTYTSTLKTATRTATQQINNQPTISPQPSEPVVTETETSAPLMSDLGFEPLPSLTFIAIDTPRASILKKQAAIPTPDMRGNQSPWLSGRGLAILSLIFVVWLVLGGGLFLIIKRLL